MSSDYDGDIEETRNHLEMLMEHLPKKTRTLKIYLLQQRHQLLRKEEEENESPVLFDFQSPVHSHPPTNELSGGPLTYTVLNGKEEENIDPDSLVEEDEKESCSDRDVEENVDKLEEEISSKENEQNSSTYSNEGDSSRRGGILSSDQSSTLDQKSGVSFFVDFEEELGTTSCRRSPPSRKNIGPPIRQRTNTLDERMTQSVHEDRRSLDSHSNLSFYVDFSSSNHHANDKAKSNVNKPSLLSKRLPIYRTPTKFSSSKPPQKKNVSSTKKTPEPKEDNFETIKFFFKKLSKKLDELPCTDDRQLSSVRRKKRLAERIMEFLEEEESKLEKGEKMTQESQIDASLNLDVSKRPVLRRERTFDLDSTGPKKLSLVEKEKKDNSKQKKNLKFFRQQRAFFLRRMKREIPKLEKRIKELEKQISSDKPPSSKRITSRKQCWPMSDREFTNR
ncbi:unnamed protein product [Lepeophtheirus salmonis]|uniref:(salmon louse) hypothetical protein n=1 Tax=Lepeophtheirus salmonis TaxID=72036 RepID=A0A7R8D174_LEPSM|nr:unnamed protein product [Lepeophtheirus salmonis]CAF2947827.1 unnamed protein product [Lepeophtheirus salmonis]